MPYRRLPNTDAARIKAMTIALEMGTELPPHKLAFSSKTILRLQNFLPQFIQNNQLYRQSIASQNLKSRDFNEVVRKSRLYLTHFIRVMNMAILRGELPAETRSYYGLAKDESSVPTINTEDELLSLGKRTIDGEELRIRKGGNPVTNPSIAVVKVRFEKFTEGLANHNKIVKRRSETLLKNNILRKEADAIILQLWNEVEKTHLNLPDDIRKNRNEDYGLVYYYRKNELEKTLLV